ncbi:hypothetical protein JR316_0001777 [Psilocybe cubensis]|uniref:Uncharacterized protein n=1 Tax=Psilocybe cubensis TaxID=181762 RepID=A0ACB8HAW7_PSICU|nr:hypothetical protein JR316_0001777 [Psilocybe cubensis]KAH9484875.1 hypothetical protein JR316_0001777 [Psilocybe cubensis]
MSIPEQLPLHLIGTQAFLPALLSYIRSLANTTSLPLDHVIFQSVLVCLIAGDKHLILRTPEEDVSFVVKLVVWLRSKTGISSVSDPDAFLRSLFFPPGSSSSNSNQTSQDEGTAENLKHLGHYRHHSHARSSLKPGTKHQPEYSRSRSFPNNLGAAQDHGTPAPDFPASQGATTTTGQRSVATTPHSPGLPSILKPQPIYPNSMPHAHTDPLPLPRRKKTLSQSKPLQLPHALVLSGLENAADSVQRSLARVLADKKVVLESRRDTTALDSDRTGFVEDGVWTLPDGFIVVYVCPWNARERPALHKSLLDKFAMSADVFISQSIRRDFHSLPFSSSPRAFHPSFVSHSNPGSPSPSHPTPLPPTHTPPVFTKALPLPRKSSAHFNPPPLPDVVLPTSFIKALQDARHRVHISWSSSLYLSDLFSATRHHSRLDAMLLTAKSMKDAEDLICASRIIGNDLTGMELVRSSGLIYDGDAAEEDDDDDPSGNENVDSIARDYVRLEDVDEHSTMSAPSRMNAKDTNEQQSLTATTTTTTSGVLDVSEVDVARIVPRVISHRVRLRNGPQDEILSSALYGATFLPHQMPKPPVVSDESQKTADKTPSVKAVLVSILSEV